MICIHYSIMTIKKLFSIFSIWIFCLLLFIRPSIPVRDSKGEGRGPQRHQGAMC
jgi:hypothetical protein